MITACFSQGKTAAIGLGATQYDRGQEICIHGVGRGTDGTTCEVHFAYEGEARTEARTATYDNAKRAWRATVPNQYLRHARAVKAYLYEKTDEDNARTIYTVVFTPTGRAAPSDYVTDDEKNAWGKLVAEVTRKIAEMEEATSRANKAVQEIQGEIERLDEAVVTWEERVIAAEGNIKQALEDAKEAKDESGEASVAATAAVADALEAIEKAETAIAQADAAQSVADESATKADAAQATADEANAKATGAVYQAVDTAIHELNGENWTYDSTNERYYQDVEQEGMTADIIPCANADVIGGNFTLIACESLDGAVRLYVHDIPSVSARVVVYGLAVRM